MFTLTTMRGQLVVRTTNNFQHVFQSHRVPKVDGGKEHTPVERQLTYLFHQAKKCKEKWLSEEIIEGFKKSKYRGVL